MWHDKCLNESVCEVKRVCRALEPVCFSEEVTIISKVCRLSAFMYSSSVTTQLDVMSYWATKRLNNCSNVSQLAGDSSWLWTQTPRVSLVRASSCTSRSLIGNSNRSCNKMEGKPGTKGFLVCMCKQHCTQMIFPPTYMTEKVLLKLWVAMFSVCFSPAVVSSGPLDSGIYSVGSEFHLQSGGDVSSGQNTVHYLSLYSPYWLHIIIILF